MCLMVKRGCHPEITQEDITCWKVVDDWDETKWMALVRGTLHKYDEVLTACDKLSVEAWRDTLGILNYVIEEGFHAYISKTHTLVKCTIPKGAEYCLGTHNEIVSNKMIVHKPKTSFPIYKITMI